MRSRNSGRWGFAGAAALMRVAGCAGAVLLATAAVAWAAAGGLDATFGSGGVATAPTLYPAQHVKVQRLGTAERYLATGFLQSGGLYVAAYTTSGLPDTTFGTNGDGVVKLFPGDTVVNTSRGDLLVDSAGRVLRVGTSTLTTALVGNGKTQTRTSTALTVVRLTQDGRLDPTFGGTGVVRLTVADRYVNGVVQLASGRIVVAGTGLTGTKNNMWERIVLVCLNEDGSLYGGFGQGGVSYETLRTSTSYCGIGVQSNDRIVVGSTAYIGSPLVAYWHVARYASTGSLDSSSFGSGGRVLSSVANLIRLVVDPTSGQITAAGQKDSTPRQIAVARYSVDGALVPTFGQSGYATLGMSGVNMYLGGLCLQPDGKTLVGCNPTGIGTTVARLNADGTSDTGFGTGGTSDLLGGMGWSGNGVAVATDGIVTSGQYPKSGGGSGLYVARYQP